MGPFLQENTKDMSTFYRKVSLFKPINIWSTSEYQTRSCLCSPVSKYEDLNFDLFSIHDLNNLFVIRLTAALPSSCHDCTKRLLFLATLLVSRARLSRRVSPPRVRVWPERLQLHVPTAWISDSWYTYLVQFAWYVWRACVHFRVPHIKVVATPLLIHNFRSTVNPSTIAN